MVGCISSTESNKYSGDFYIMYHNLFIFYIYNLGNQLQLIMTTVSSSLKEQEKNRFREWISGLVAGIISVTVCNPLDIARTRLNAMSSPNHNSNRYLGFRHTMRVIYQQEGLKGFYTGFKVNIKAIPFFHSLFFPIYEGMKQWCRNKNYPHWKEYLTSTIVAGAICNTLTNPIWVVRTRIMVQYLHPQNIHYPSQSIHKIMRQMVKEEGVGSLFKGLSASILGISNAVIYFFIYENMKNKITEVKQKQFTTYYVFLASILSKSVASTITYPFIVIRTIMHDSRAGPDPGFFSILKQVVRQKGIQGLYAGLKPDLIRLLPSNTIVFIVYELMKRKIH